MQINRLSHLIFPDPPLTTSGKSSDGSAVGSGSAGKSAVAELPLRRTAATATADAAEAAQLPSTVIQPGVIVSIRGAGNAGAGADAPTDVVYTDKRNTPAVDSDQAAHFAGTKSEAFVNFAVQTMRQFADEQERSKSQAKPSANESAHLIPRNLGEVQKLAARFKLFA